MQFRYAKPRKLYVGPDFEKLVQIMIFGQKSSFFTKMGQFGISYHVISIAFVSFNCVPSFIKILGMHFEIST